MNSNMGLFKIKSNKFKLVVVFTLLIYLINILSPVYSVFGENINIADINIYSRASILVDSDTGDVLYSKNSDSKVYPASTTKILTAILVIEKLDLNSTVVVSETAVKIPAGSSNAALKTGEVISVKDLLYCLMLKSGNDSANVLAEAVSGTVPNFILLMNQKVKDLGLIDTNFTNAHGFHDNNHYTTATDMMKILKYAITKDTFKTICETKEYTIEPTNLTAEKRVYQNTNRLILTKEDSYLSDYYQYCLGGKTGFTDEAGRTLVAFGKKGDRNLILGTFDVMDVGKDDGRYVDAISLFEYGFNNFTKILGIKKDDFKFQYIDKNNGYKYILGIKEDVYFNAKVIKDKNGVEINSMFSMNTANNIDETLLNKYTYDTTATDNCQVVGSLNLTFNQNSQLISKNVDLVLLEKIKLGIINSISTNVWPSFKNIVFTILVVLSIIFIFLILLIIRNNVNKKIRASRKLKNKPINKFEDINNYTIPINRYKTSAKEINIKRRTKR